MMARRRKRNRRNPAERGEVIVECKIADGVPLVQRTITETGPSIPSEIEHKSVTFEEKPFGLFSVQDFDRIKGSSSGLVTKHGTIRFSSENDLAQEVKTLINRIIIALDLYDEAEVHSEVATFNIRQDLWVVTMRGVPVGVIEVKKPDIKGKVKGMSHPNVLGELYDFMRHLPNFYGVSPVFGIVTNFVSWRFAWLPGDGVDFIAALDENLENEDGTEDPSDESFLVRGGASASKANSIVHEVHEEEDFSDDENVDIPDTDPRVFHVSKLYTRDDPDTMRAIVASVCKMVDSTVLPFSSPFDRLEDRTLLKFVKGEAKQVVWTRLNVPPQWNKVGLPRKYLYAIEDLGRGANGRVWLTCTSSGAVCVLKFSLADSTKDLDREYAVWKNAYPEFPVYREMWCGHEALRMPHFSAVLPVDRASKVALVKTTLLERFVTNNLVHGDVYWRNIGLYKDRQGKEHAVVFDMGSVSSGSQADWVEAACTQLLT
ncbi:MAG: hypothetical protein SGILL_003835 [Bacillariaceae sp.]